MAIDLEFKEKLQNSWCMHIAGPRWARLYGKLARLKPILRAFNKKFYCQIGEKVQQAREEISQVQVIVFERGNVRVAEAREELTGVQERLFASPLDDFLCNQEKELVGHDVDHFTSPEGIPGVPETNFSNRPNSLNSAYSHQLALVCCVVYHRVEEELGKTDESDTTSVSESAVTDVMASDERVEDSAPDEDFAVDPCEAEDLEVEETGEGTMDD
ncbi:hypothetical protein RHSIM_Rhsim06G0019100 [Rhododendron simsii]|uniref:Uncharacterized protein n=1 Tax=Rhododendron simsii TaxID=118357 RepID=A0A834LLF4_RHOSS|nr:hypothetical protein RHSIM_Rhsim06G0019100 [Rhododendron simsii]